nr:CONSTANS-like 5 protein [Ipomoea batatas]
MSEVDVRRPPGNNMPVVRGIDDTAVVGGGARQPVTEDNIRAGKDDTDAALRVVEVVDSMRVAAEDIDVALPVVDDTAAAAGDDNIRAAGAVEAVGYNIQTGEVWNDSTEWDLRVEIIKLTISIYYLATQPSFKLLSSPVEAAMGTKLQQESSFSDSGRRKDGHPRTFQFSSDESYSCKRALATVFCHADTAFLYMTCDSKIHTTALCEQAPASFTCKVDAAALCVTCNRDYHSVSGALPRLRRRCQIPWLCDLNQRSRIG